MVTPILFKNFFSSPRHEPQDSVLIFIAVPPEQRGSLETNPSGGTAMGGRFGKYGDLKRKAALRKSWKEKGRLQKDSAQKDSAQKDFARRSPGKRKAEKDFRK